MPDTELYSEFDENLRDAMEQETRLFVASQIQENRPVPELLTANYSFLNERLAKHYGIPNVYGNHYRRFTFTDGVRGGLLGQASILTVTSYGNRTSVVMRGRWVLANLLGAPPPPPPPDVPALKDAGMDGAPRSLRERMEVHRKNPACASCHQRMDPIGFALENFDADGKWRTVSDDQRIDAPREKRAANALHPTERLWAERCEEPRRAEGRDHPSERCVPSGANTPTQSQRPPIPARRSRTGLDLVQPAGGRPPVAQGPTSGLIS